MKDLVNIKYWIFDLDNTLYSGQTQVFSEVDKKMSSFISKKFNVDLVKAKEIQKKYFYEYGTTLSGLMNHDNIDPEEFLEFVHDIDISWLPKDEVLREELIFQMEKVGASASMGLILNPQTGAVLSMVNLPDYNPNFPNDYNIELQTNKIATDLIEPGSTFKIVTMAAALENDISLTDEYNVEGPYNFHNIKMIEDSEPHKVLNVKEILAF